MKQSPESYDYRRGDHTFGNQFPKSDFEIRAEEAVRAVGDFIDRTKVRLGKKNKVSPPLKSEMRDRV